MATVERRKSHGQTVYHVKIRRKGYPPRSAAFVSPGMPRPLSGTLPFAESPLPDGEGILRRVPATLYEHCLAPGQKQF